MPGLTFAYYCSGHGLGHATRVSAFASVILSLEPSPTVYIVSSAPRNAFSNAISAGALYRFKSIDPVIVQPMAYRVDRPKSVKALELFMQEKDSMVKTEVDWLKLLDVDCVLSDSAFLGCLAAKAAGIPSVLITNFTFDSVFSYLETSFVDQSPELLHPDTFEPPIRHSIIPADIPIPKGTLASLVGQVHAGFRAADLLCLLPGAIPIPSFTTRPALPSSDWVDLDTSRFRPEIVSHLLQDPKTWKIHPSIAFPSYQSPTPKRKVISSPLLVRPTNKSVYTTEGRARLLSSIGVPSEKHDAWRVLVVSFGGQIFHTPKSRTPSRSTTPSRSVQHTPKSALVHLDDYINPPPKPTSQIANGNVIPKLSFDPAVLTAALRLSIPQNGPSIAKKNSLPVSPRIATNSHLWVPGAPPAAKADLLNPSPFPIFTTTPPTPQPNEFPENPLDYWTIPRLLPDESWIAIVCGASKEDGDEDLPNDFYIAPKDIYMPDLTAVADVLLGKLGYGGVSECLDSATPFVYVPRPLFIEEHGLRLLLEREGTGVELSRASYEAGDWADAIQTAYEQGKAAKSRKRNHGDDGTRHRKVIEMAQEVVQWVKDWKTDCAAGEQ